MQRTLKTLLGGSILALAMSFHSTASAQDWYVPTSSWQPVPASQPVVVTRSYMTPAYVVPGYPTYVVNTPVVYAEPIYVSRPVYVEPVFYSHPVQVYRPLVSSPRVTREEIKSRPGHYEYEQKGKFQAFDGRRMKTYRYEYEVDQRPGRTKVKFDID